LGKTAAQEVQLGGGSAAVPPFKDRETWDYLHDGLYYTIEDRMTILPIRIARSLAKSA
jgi:hypothetical protein